MSPPAGIIFNADDLGMTHDVTRAVVDAYLAGSVDSASACVTGPASELDFAKNELVRAPGLPLGLHVNLTEGFPVASRRAGAGFLDKAGRFRAASSSLADEPSLSPEAIRREILAQLGRFRRLFKRAPLHLDSHQHFAYLSPAAFSAFLAVSAREDIPIRSPRPFCSGERLGRFMETVVRRYGVRFNFSPGRRASELRAVLARQDARRRTDDLLLDCDRPPTLSGRAVRRPGDSLEAVCHLGAKQD